MKTNLKQLAFEKQRLPQYPRTPHIPHKPNMSDDDVLAKESESKVLFGSIVTIEEKIDGASVGISVLDGHPIVRNRDHILHKGFVKDTAAKKQFVPLWNWYYENEHKFKNLEGYSVFGEWMLAQHGIYYTRLPDWFIPYDLYDYEKDIFLSPIESRKLLTAAGFFVPVLRYQGVFEGGYAQLEEYANLMATWADEKSEGIYVKVCDGNKITHRFKMVQEDFQRGALWNPKQLKKNICVKGNCDER